MSDLISREDAIKHIKAYRDEFKEDFGIDSEDGDDASHHFGYIAGLNRATRMIECLPSAQPEPITAYWKKDCFGAVFCSKCGGIRRDNRVGHVQWCNSCGCFMRGEQEGEEK